MGDSLLSGHHADEAPIEHDDVSFGCVRVLGAICVGGGVEVHEADAFETMHVGDP